MVCIKLHISVFSNASFVRLLENGANISFIANILFEFQAQVEMNWNIVNFLPKAASCQEFFKVLFSFSKFFFC